MRFITKFLYITGVLLNLNVRDYCAELMLFANEVKLLLRIFYKAELVVTT